MTAPNRNTLWARVFVDELARAGLRYATLAPGSRSTPLVLALARHDEIDVTVHLDERSAAFHALGVGKATGHPAAVVTTSGTAAANLHPAVVEADQAESPLLALTADRPHELRGTDANQAVDQLHLYGDAVRAFHDLPQPRPEERALRHLRATADRAVAEAIGRPAGPVHVNLPFAKPLEDRPVDDDVPKNLADRSPLAVEGRPDGRPFTEITPRHSEADADTLDRLETELSDADRPIIVAGPDPHADRLGPAVIALARATATPLLADPLSGARFTPGAGSRALTGYDLYLASDRVRSILAPDLVVRLGTSPTSKRVNHWLRDDPGIDQVVVDDGRRFKDHQHAAARQIRADPACTAAALAERAFDPVPKPWQAAWREADQRTRAVLDDELDREPFEATVLARAAELVPEHGQLVVGNSMPIRDLDGYAGARDVPVRVLGNRGASGIDGLVSTAAGAALAADVPTLAVIGDLSCLHDINGFTVLREAEPPLVLAVVNNDGGGIFHRLPISEHDRFTECFATPHGRTFHDAASLHGIDHETVDGPGQAADALASALEDPHGQLVEIPSQREANHRRHREAEEAVQAAVEQTLDEEDPPWSAN